MERGLVMFGRLLPGAVGRTMRWVERAAAVLARVGALGLAVAPRGMTMGWVVAAPAGMPAAGIKPDGCGGLTAGIGPDPGGV